MLTRNRRLYLRWVRCGLVALILLCGHARAIALEVNDEQLRDLASSQEWRALLHFDSGRPRFETDSLFYVAGATAVDPYQELRYLLQNASPELVCRFPARYEFIQAQTGQSIAFDPCDGLDSFLTNVEGDSVSLFFASASLGSPMSYFGHTFLRFNKPHDPHFSYTISFAGEIPEDIRFHQLAIRGLSGSLSGAFVLAPHYVMIEKYNEIEQRVLVEYKLAFTPDEMRRMLLHAYELYLTDPDYSFLFRNCTSGLLVLFEVARPELRLQERFMGIVLPSQLIRVLEKDGIAVEKSVRQPLAYTLEGKYQSLERHEQAYFRRVRQSDSKVLDLENSGLDEQSQERIRELLVAYYRLRFKRFNRAPADYQDVKSMSYQPSDLEPNQSIEAETRPFRPTYLELGVGYSDSDLYQVLRFRPLLLDRYDRRFARFTQGALEFGKVSVRHRNNGFTVDSIDIILVESLNRLNPFFRLPSWRFYAGFNRLLDDQVITFQSEAGMGVAFGGRRWFGHVMPTVSYFAAPATVGAVGIAALSLRHGPMYVGVDSRYSVIFSADKPPHEVSAFSVIRLGESVAFRVDYETLSTNLQFNVRYSF